MSAIAHNSDFARKVGVSQKVGEEFHEADKRKSAISSHTRNRYK